ncbi:MAG: hypothetical protein R8P61_06730 [Bacteroidia bacterium]|nr:hypothetical protein [Bacteroidia bacterium]
MHSTSSLRCFIKQNRSALYCFFLSGLFFFLASLDMQGSNSGKLVSISPLIGPEIDHDEYFRYRFQEIEDVHKRDFLSARVFQLKENLFLLQIELKGGKERIKSFKKDILTLFRLNVQRYGKKLLRSYDRLESEMDEGQHPIVRIELTNDINMIGQVISLGTDTLSLKSSIGEFKFSLETVRLITFEEQIDSKDGIAFAK